MANLIRALVIIWSWEMNKLPLHNLSPGKKRTKKQTEDNGVRHEYEGEMITVRALCKRHDWKQSTIRSDMQNNGISLTEAVYRYKLGLTAGAVTKKLGNPWRTFKIGSG